MAAGEKEPGALKTIGELSRELGVAQHILRYWETRFPQLRPMQRAGNRRYYRPADVDLTRRIHRLLDQEGYTVRGVQKLLRDKSGDAPSVSGTEIPAAAAPAPAGSAAEVPVPAPAPSPAIDVFRLIEIRNRLASLIEG
ncbi:MAG: MerR family transcriptional regulator [Pseudomonadota bacterium]|nr:MerR family transcriptional regulator [Pseudomonadota bacterium]